MRIQSCAQLLGGLLFAIWSQVCSAEQAVDLLWQLYAEHQPWRGQTVMKGAALEKFFEHSLYRLYRRDRDCQAPGWGVGLLDFDPILDGQDYDDQGISTPTIKNVGQRDSGTYQVSFQLYPKFPETRREVQYHLRKSAKEWRIFDIGYSKGRSLRQILSSPCE
jgi:hypothetical protein